MKRTIIMMDGCGRIAVPSDTSNVWMSEMDTPNLLARVKETMRK